MSDFLYTLLIQPLYTLIECIYVLFYKITDNHGLSVIGVSIGITLLCLPLYAVAEKWQQIERDKQKSMEGMLSRIKDTFAKDERYMMTNAYYKESHYSPIMALRSSFGLLIQIPFFMAAYAFLSQLEPLKGTSFLFIKDLGNPDRFAMIGSFPVNFLPIAMTLINIAAGAIYTKGFKWKEKATIYGMALIFLVILYDSPSGLVLYWTMNNVFSLVKNVFYKLKNPLKSFYLCCCVIMIPAIIFVDVKAHTKITNKLIFTILALSIYAVPLILKSVKKLINGPFKNLVENKKSRHSLFLINCLLLTVLLGYFVPSALIASEASSFANLGNHSNPQYFLNYNLTLAVSIFIVWSFCIYFLFNKKVQTVFALIFTALSICSLLNVFVFAMNYGDISNTLKFLHTQDFGDKSIWSLINILTISIASAAVLFIVKIKDGLFIKYAYSILTFGLVVICFINTNTISSDYNSSIEKQGKTKPVFSLSSNPEEKNLIILMLDQAKGQYVEEIFKENESLKSDFSGFTYYKNSLAFNGHTIMGAPAVFGGYESTPNEINNREKNLPDEKRTTLVEKHNQALLMLPVLFSNNNFNVSMSDPSWPDYKHYYNTDFVDRLYRPSDEKFSNPYEKIVNQENKINCFQTTGPYFGDWSIEYTKNNPDKKIPNNAEALLKRNMMFYSLFRTSPIVLRKLIYKNSNYWNTDDNAENGKAALDCYAALYFFNDWTNISTENKSSYLQIENQLTHENDADIFAWPNYEPVSNYTEESKGPSKYGNKTGYHTEMATFVMLGKWFNYLKENNAWNNTRIVITSDHGGSEPDEYMDHNPELDSKISGGQYKGRMHYDNIFFFKDFNSNGDLVINENKLMTSADSASLIVDGIIKNPENPFTGNKIFSISETEKIKSDGIFITCCDQHQPSDNTKYEYKIKPEEWWKVKDNIFDSKNWTQEMPKKLF